MFDGAIGIGGNCLSEEDAQALQAGFKVDLQLMAELYDSTTLNSVWVKINKMDDVTDIAIHIWLHTNEVFSYIELVDKSRKQHSVY